MKVCLAHRYGIEFVSLMTILVALLNGCVDSADVGTWCSPEITYECCMCVDTGLCPMASPGVPVPCAEPTDAGAD